MPKYNDWKVSYTNISFFKKALGTHQKVDSFQRTNDILFDITLTNGSKIKVLLVNEYTLGLAAIHKALTEFPGVEYVVTCTNWNGYTREAKDYGRDNNLGVFDVGEFFAALYWNEPKKYHKKDQDGNPIYHYKSA